MEEGPAPSPAAAGAVGLVPQQASGLAPGPRSASPFPPSILPPSFHFSPAPMVLKTSGSSTGEGDLPFPMGLLEGGAGQCENPVTQNVGDDAPFSLGSPSVPCWGVFVHSSDGKREGGRNPERETERQSRELKGETVTETGRHRDMERVERGR